MITSVTFSNFLHFLCAILIYTHGTSIDGIGNSGKILVYFVKVLGSLLYRKFVFQNMENRVKYMKDRQNIELICHQLDIL